MIDFLSNGQEPTEEQLKEAVLLSIELWTWLSENPEKDKYDYEVIYKRDIMSHVHDCPLCSLYRDFEVVNNRTICNKRCPLNEDFICGLRKDKQYYYKTLHSVYANLINSDLSNYHYYIINVIKEIRINIKSILKDFAIEKGWLE